MTWILVVAVASIVYFLGWMALLYVAGACVLFGGAGSLFQPNSGASSVVWITYTFDLEDNIETVAEKLKQGFNLFDEEFNQDGKRLLWEADNKYYVFKLEHQLGEASYQLEIASDSMDLDDLEQQTLRKNLASVLGVDITQHIS